MPSVFTESLRLEEQGIGENNNSWGERLNRTIEFSDKAIAGALEVAVSSGTVTLTTANNQEDQARYRMLVLTGTLTGSVVVQVPEVSKEYIVIDTTTRGGNSITMRLGAAGATQVVPVLGSTQVATDGTAWFTPAYHPASDSEVNTGTNQYKWVTPAGLKQNVDTRLGTTGNLGDAAQRTVGTAGANVPDTAILNTRLGTTGNLGDAAQRTVGTASANVPDTAILNTRLGTTGNLGSMAQRNVTVSTSNPSGGVDGDIWLQYVS